MGSIVNSVLDVVGIGPASKQLSASKDAASQATQASNYAIDLQREMFNKQLELQEPWRAAGLSSLRQMEGGAYSQPAAFTGQVNMLADPGYQFRLSQGLEAMNRQAAARGGLISGAALKAGQRFGQDYASGEYGNAYDRALTEYNAAKNYSDTGYNRLAALAGTGQTTSAELGRAGTQFGQNAGNLRMTNAANQGNALLSQGNIRASQYQNYGGALDQALGMFGGMGGGGGGSGGYSPFTSGGYSPDMSGNYNFGGNNLL